MTFTFLWYIQICVMQQLFLSGQQIVAHGPHGFEFCLKLVLFLDSYLKTGFSNRGSGTQYMEYFTCTGKGVNLF